MTPDKQQILSSSFQKFLKEAKAIGREKADGFDHQVLKSLFGSEQQLALEVLFDLAKQGDTTAIDAFRSFAADRAVPFLKDLLPLYKPPSLQHAYACFSLWSLTQCTDHCDELTNDLALADALFRGVVVLLIAKSVPTPLTRQALWRVVETEEDSTARGTAARGLLYFSGHLREPLQYISRFDALLRSIYSDHAIERSHGIQELKKILESA